MKRGETIPAEGPNNHCFGCGPDNPHGLKLEFADKGGHSVEVEFEVPAHFCGAPNVVHGGIQATLLDEACGFACRTLFPDDTALKIVTAEFSLRYRRPVPTGVQLTVRGEVLRSEGRNIFVRATIDDSRGDSLTTCDARWVRLETSQV